MPGHPTKLIWIIIGQGPTVLTVGGGWFGNFPLSSLLSRHGLKFCLEELLNPK